MELNEKKRTFPSDFSYYTVDLALVIAGERENRIRRFYFPFGAADVEESDMKIVIFPDGGKDHRNYKHAFSPRKRKPLNQLSGSSEYLITSLSS